MLFFAVGVLLLTGAVWVGLELRHAHGAADQLRSSPRRSGCAAAISSARVPVGDGDEEFGSLSRAFNRMTHQLADAAERADRGQPPARSAPALYRDRAGGRLGRRDRPRPRRAASICRTARPRCCSAPISTSRSARTLAEAVPEMARASRRGGAPARPARRRRRSSSCATAAASTLAGAHRRRARRGRGQGLCRHLRRRDRTAVGAAQGGLGRCRAPHRARDQEPADADPALGRAPEAQISQARSRNDPETFATCTDTIIRHVGDIGRMVDEFSSFARMPAPVFRDEDLAELRAPGGVPAAHRDARDPLRARPAADAAARSPAIRARSARRWSTS